MRIFVLLCLFVFVQYTNCFVWAQDLKQASNIHQNLVQQSLYLHEGDFVQGHVTNKRVNVDLMDAQGHLIRRLVSANGISNSFMFVNSFTGTYYVVSNGKLLAPNDLVIERIIPREQQHPVDSEIQSPKLRNLVLSLKSNPQAKVSLLDAFWQDIAQHGTPLVEALPESSLACCPNVQSTLNAASNTVLVTFLWRGAHHNVRLRSSPSGDHDWLKNLQGTDVWYESYIVPPTTRMSYQLAPDIPTLPVSPAEQRHALLATAQRDPLNPLVWPKQAVDVYQQQSIFVLPGAPQQPWVDQRTDIVPGKLEHYQLNSTILGNQRDLFLYSPSLRDGKGKVENLLILFDAHLYTTQINTATILDNLIADGFLTPTAAIIISNPDALSRSVELPPNRLFARFISQEVLPWSKQLGIHVKVKNTTIAGSSYGGLAAAYVAMTAPETIGNVLSLSGSFWWDESDQSPKASPSGAEWLTREFIRHKRLPLRFYLAAGLFETGKAQNGILETTRHLRDVLLAKEYDVFYTEYAGGHDFINWRGELACGLIHLNGVKPQQMNARQYQQWFQSCLTMPSGSR